MALSAKEKNKFFSFVKENLSWCTQELLIKGHFHEEFKSHNMEDCGFSFRTGCTKVCLFHSNYEDYVIKFSTDKFDYCEKEYKNYWAAVYNKVDSYFPFTILLGSFNGIKFYIQERAVCNEAKISDIWYSIIRNDYESWKDNESEDDINDNIWSMVDELDDETRLSYCFGEDTRLFDFIDEYCINDLHEGNFGYINGRLVIIDFSGYGYKVMERSY